MNGSPHNDRVLCPGDVAKLFGVDSKTVTRWARAGKIPSFRTPGGHRRFYLSAIAPLLTTEDES